MSGGKTILLREESLEIIANELGVPVDKLDLEALLNDSMFFFLYFLKEKEGGNNFYLGEKNKVYPGMTKLKYEKELLDYLKTGEVDN